MGKFLVLDKVLSESAAQHLWKFWNQMFPISSGLTVRRTSSTLLVSGYIKLSTMLEDNLFCVRYYATIPCFVLFNINNYSVVNSSIGSLNNAQRS